MTIAISIKVNNGVVLATDSAATISTQNPDGLAYVMNVYQNAEKLFNLCKSYPIGVITWGSGAIGQASIASLIRDFRQQKIKELGNEQKFSIQSISGEFAEFIHQLYEKAFENWKEKPSIGFLVAGYSKEQDFAEEWIFQIINGELQKPAQVRGLQDIGIIWNGEPEAINRIILGQSMGFFQVLKEAGVPDQQIDKVILLAREKLTVPFVIGSMPIQDTIDLARFLVETTINFSKFSPGAPTVGGPVDIATITKHEGFKWVARKHYYSNDLNT
jgi:hypothetical protein